MSNTSYRICITGNIGSGKTTIARNLCYKYSIPILNTDLEARKIMESNPDVISKVKKNIRRRML